MQSSPRLVLAAIAFAALSALPPAAIAEGPSDLVGTWTWSWKDGEGKTHKHILDLEAAGGKLTGRERFDDQESIKVDDLKLEGKDLSFVTTRDGRRAQYKGKTVGTDTINGVVNVVTNGQANEFQWTAERAVKPK